MSISLWFPDCSLPKFHGILQAKILQWVAIPFSNRSSQPRDPIQVSRNARGYFTVRWLRNFESEIVVSQVCLFLIPWTIAYQTPLSVEFFRQEYCRGLPLPSPRDLPDPGIEPKSPALQADSLPSNLFKISQLLCCHGCRKGVCLCWRKVSRLSLHRRLPT